MDSDSDATISDSDNDRRYRCSTCHADLASAGDLVSKRFNGQHGRAYLFKNVINVTQGELQDRAMTTGAHVVCDISCSRCSTVVGWKYEIATEPSQRYKEGKYILERNLVVKE